MLVGYMRPRAPRLPEVLRRGPFGARGTMGRTWFALVPPDLSTIDRQIDHNRMIESCIDEPNVMCSCTGAARCRTRAVSGLTAVGARAAQPRRARGSQGLGPTVRRKPPGTVDAIIGTAASWELPAELGEQLAGAPSQRFSGGWRGADRRSPGISLWCPRQDSNLRRTV